VERVYLSNPLTASADRLKAEDLRRDLGDAPDELHCLLKYSEVMINYFSTIGLEAAICDLPTIHVGFDDSVYGLKFNTQTGFQLRQTHNQRPLRLAAARVAKSRAELLGHLEAYLGNRDLERDARHEYALSECGWLDGQASERLSRLLAETLKAA
jgi:CDP-glycerol glycerophosphotransferase (TagB/SpsB family)